MNTASGRLMIALWIMLRYLKWNHLGARKMTVAKTPATEERFLEESSTFSSIPPSIRRGKEKVAVTAVAASVGSVGGACNTVDDE